MQRAMELSENVLALARKRGLTLGTAESCTGGLVAAALTSVPGSSDVLIGGIVSYWASVKQNVLGVPASVIEGPGVVSEQCARAMSDGACSVLGCDVSVSTTGIAGPGGAEEGKPVGTVCFAVSGSSGVQSATCHFDGTREEVRQQAVQQALNMLVTYLI